MMRYSQIRDMDISNGIGITASIFFQGCSHHCVGCFNPETWNFNGGEELTKDIEEIFLNICKEEYIKCVSLLGGEPFDQDAHELYRLLKRIKDETNKTICVWSGYLFEDLIQIEIIKDCFHEGLIDYLIDGEFQLDKRDLRLKLRGSTNQRVIDIKQTLERGEIITKFK